MMAMRADWKAIRYVYHQFGEAQAREWSETPLMDTYAVTLAMSDEPYSIAKVPHKLEHLPVNPVVVRLARDNAVTACRIEQITGRQYRVIGANA
jgi:hypothetical protein